VSPGPAPIILVVEDSDEDFDTLREALERAARPGEVRRATTGGGCLSLLRDDGGKPLRPAFVLMDLNTPGLDGREALKEIKADARLRALPVVVFSTSASPSDLEFCYRSGANAYHVKPTRYTDHLNVLHELLSYWLAYVALPDLDEVAP
jgi:CheY-like chemotaxis protein